MKVLMKKTVIKCYLVGGFNPTPLKNMKVYEFVSWDDDIPKLNGKIKARFQTNNQIYNHHIPIVLGLKIKMFQTINQNWFINPMNYRYITYKP